MKYSFVLPAYKSRFLSIAIDSILNQSYKDFELIIVNDASPDDIDSIVNLYDDHRIEYHVNTVNIGGNDLVAQWNRSISYAKGEYLILASDDDIYDSEYLKKMDILVRQYPNNNVFRPQVQYIDENGNIIRSEECLKELNSSICYLEKWISGSIGSGVSFFIFKRSALSTINGFASYPLAWFADDATVLRLADKGIVVFAEPLFYFRHSGDNISSKSNSYSVLSRKILATELFYKEVMSYLSMYKQNNRHDSDLVQSLTVLIPLFLQNDRLCGQLNNSSFYTCIKCLPQLLKIDFVSRVDMVRWYLISACRRFYRIAKKIIK